MRLDEAFVIGALTGAAAVWLWGRTIEDRNRGADARGPHDGGGWHPGSRGDDSPGVEATLPARRRA